MRFALLGVVGSAVGLSLVWRRRKSRKEDGLSSVRRRTLPSIKEERFPQDSVEPIRAICLVLAAFIAVWAIMFGGLDLWVPMESAGRNTFVQAFLSMLMSFVITATVLWISAMRSNGNEELLKDSKKTDATIAEEMVDFSGMWVKDSKASTPIDEVFDIMHVNPVIRKAICLVRGLEIEQDNTTFKMSVISVIRFLKVSEKYTLDGKSSQWQRRDMRRGRHTGHVQWNPHHRTLSLWLDWDAPYPGRGCDEFCLMSKTQLRVRSTLFSGSKTASYDTIYNKKL